MKIHLLSLTVMVLCIATARSSPFPYWLDEIQDLNTKSLLELQEQDGGSASPPRLRCFICESREDCANEEELATCESGFNCSTVTIIKIGAVVTEDKVKVCLPSILCSSDFICSNRNQTGDVASCNLDCCGFDECNAEPTSPPTTPPSTAPPTTPTTTPAPRTISLRGSSGTLRSPGFSKGSYPPNLDITWIIPGRNLGGLRLQFLTIDTERRVDIITIKRGNTVFRAFSGVYRSTGKRSLSIPLYQEDSPCDDDDESDDDVDYLSYDTPYDRLAAIYGRYRRQSRGRPPRAPCVYVPFERRQISINFSSDGNDTGQRGFSARFRVFGGDRDDK